MVNWLWVWMTVSFFFFEHGVESLHFQRKRDLGIIIFMMTLAMVLSCPLLMIQVN